LWRYSTVQLVTGMHLSVVVISRQASYRPMVAKRFVFPWNATKYNVIPMNNAELNFLT